MIVPEMSKLPDQIRMRSPGNQPDKLTASSFFSFNLAQRHFEADLI
jgi:hypothetical protein